MALGTILVVEDDAAIRRGLADAVAFAGYCAVEASDGTEGLEWALGGEVDLVLLDVLMPGIDGFEVLDRIRQARPGLPVILLTALGQESERVRGLRGGADDYVVKPFAIGEVLARIEAVLRRSAERPGAVRRVRVAGRTIDVERSEVVLADGTRTSLSEKEAGVLAYLSANAGRVVSRDELLGRVWGLDPRGMHTRTVDMTVARLRDHLGDGSGAIIETVRGRGYRLAGDAEVDP